MPKRKSSTLTEEKESPCASPRHKSTRHDELDDDEEYVYESDHEAEHESVSRYMERVKDEEEDGDQDEEMMDTKEKKKEAQHRTTRVLQYGGHPRGVRPWGNFFFDHETEVQQHKFRHPKISGWGALSSLEDDKLLDLIKFMDLHTLCSLSLVSRACYVLCFEEEIWRHMCLTLWKGDFRYQHTWRQTVGWEYVRRKRMESEQKQMEVTEEGKALLPKSSAPIRVTSYYSDLLFQPWYCLSMDLSRFTWIDNIDRRSELTVEQFIAEYERPMRPVILTDIVQQWPAATEWTREKLLSQYSDVIYKVGAYRMTMANYLAYSAQAREETPLYLFDNAYPTNTPEFAKQYTVPPHFSTDYFDYIEDPALRPSYRWILIGPARSGSTFHKDPNGTSAWNGLISGAKKWILFPPDYVPPGVFPSQDDAEVITPISVMEWLIHYYHQCHDMDDDTEEQTAANPLAQHFATKMAKREQQATSCSTSRTQRRVEPIECVCKPGELIFIPAGWYHTAINIEESIAVTQNYVSEQNLGHVLTFLEKEGQPKRALLEALEAGVEKHQPGLLDKVKQPNAQKNQPKPASLWSKLMAPTSTSDITSDTSTSTFSFSSILNQQQEPEDEIVA